MKTLPIAQTIAAKAQFQVSGGHIEDHLCMYRINSPAIPPSSEEAIAKIRQVEEKIRQSEQFQFRTEHVFHAGMYARTVRIPAGVVFTTALVKCPTLLIGNGTFDMLLDNEVVHMEGYNVLPAEAGRKQVYITRTDCQWTVIFPTHARTVEEAEAEFTDEADTLLSRVNENDIVVTEAACLESRPQPRS